jgi:hypothetical protein
MGFGEVFDGICGKNGWPVRGSEATLSLTGGRSQKVLWTQFRHEGKDMARLHSTIGAAGTDAPVRLESAALRLNFNLPHGAIAIHEGNLVLCETFLVADADPGEVESSVRFIAEMADRYEKQIFGTDRN